jgi:hypothetical protein
MNTRRENKMPWRFCAGVFLSFGLAFSGLGLGIEMVQAALPDHLVINEVQLDSLAGAGGSSDDFIELYNPTDTAVSLAGWSIQKQAASSTATIYKKALAGTIPAKGHYLIVRGDTDTSQALKDMADILTAATFSLASDNAIFLVNDDVNITDKTDANIVDFLGFGKAENYEGIASASNPAEGKSLVREPEGDDTDNNSLDFVVLAPTPQPATPTVTEPKDLGGTVLITVSPEVETVTEIGPDTATLNFSVNASARARIDYGLSSTYGFSSPFSSVMPNTVSSITLAGLSCGTTYHYSIWAETLDASDSHVSADATFMTLPCGIRLDSLVMTRSEARADNSYPDGWSWDMDITVWDLAETSLKLKFTSWSGAMALAAGGNMRYSVDGAAWREIGADDSYPTTGLSLVGIDQDSVQSGRQVRVKIEMKVPVGTLAGYYDADYGILTERP